MSSQGRLKPITSKKSAISLFHSWINVARDVVMWGLVPFNAGDAFLNNFEWKITNYSRNRTTQISSYPYTLRKHTLGSLVKIKKQRKKNSYDGRNSFSSPKVFLYFCIRVLLLPFQVKKCLISVNTSTVKTITHTNLTYTHKFNQITIH